MPTSSPIPLFKDRRILLGVSGSIAAYKAVELASMLTKSGAEVDVLLTEAAQAFVSALTFQSVTGRRAFGDADLWGNEGHVLHIGLAEAADLYVIAPATANTLAQLAHGGADSLLTVTALAARCPLLVAPAMDAGMFDHPATQANLETLRQRGAIVAGPASGRLASGLEGFGRLVEPPELLGHIRLALGRNGALKGYKVVVTAGGTWEAIDPVRVVANRSSGKQGYALAQAALDRGGRVTLIAGPTAHLPTPVGAERFDVVSAAEMSDSVLVAVEGADALLMAAAVADFKPAEIADHKLKKGAGPPVIQMASTEDILSQVSAHRRAHGWPRVIVGFAAESQDIESNARIKLEQKGIDLIVANDITAGDSGFAVDTNKVTLIDREGGLEELPLMSKVQVAERIVDRVVHWLATSVGKS